MSAGPTISVAVVTGLRDAIAAAGGDPDQIIRASGLKSSMLRSPDGFMASSAFARLLEESARATGDDCFGLHFGEKFDPKDIGALTYVVINSPTVAIAIQNIERYVHIHNNAARVSFSLEGSRGYLRYVVADPVHAVRQHNEFATAVLVKAFRMIGASGWTPLEVQFMHDAPAQTSEHVRFFGCPVVFGCAANALGLEHDFVQQLVSAADERLYRILKQHVERILSGIPSHEHLPSAVRRAVVEAMATGAPKREWVANALSMSPRTLERRLKNEHGVSYKELVNDVRRQFAADYLKDRGRTITEVAFLLGYSEVSAFNRAFKRSTGVTPVQYREQSAR